MCYQGTCYQGYCLVLKMFVLLDIPSSDICFQHNRYMTLHGSGFPQLYACLFCMSATGWQARKSGKFEFCKCPSNIGIMLGFCYKKDLNIWKAQHIFEDKYVISHLCCIYKADIVLQTGKIPEKPAILYLNMAWEYFRIY